MRDRTFSSFPLRRPALLFVSFGLAFAQPNPPATNPLDGVTPHALKAGDPSSTYLLSNLDQINYYNGSVSVTLPLVHISGRGEVSHTVALGIKPPLWSATATIRAQDHQYQSFGSGVFWFSTGLTRQPNLRYWAHAQAHAQANSRHQPVRRRRGSA